MDLLGKMKFSIETMTMVEKFLAGIQVTVLGLVIVFIALAVLYFAVIIMEMLLNKVQETEETVESGLSADETVDLEDKEPVYEEENTVYDTELVAVIVAAVAASLHVPAQDIVVKRIKQAKDPTPKWTKMGRIEQINNTL